ncbi:TonB-dependent receptor [Burkholderiaceae bacterium DAT-1]|nr:TonB-dependent receptor [Burkholderiaceae bacterium DAT-1]
MMRNKMARSLIAQSVVLALAGMGAVWADDAAKTDDSSTAAKKAKAADKDAAKVESINIVGIRRAIQDKVSTKQNSDSIVEAISAEDIGKLPDISIADSLARIPGVSAQRVDGRDQTINFRGMSGDFSGTLLNGREQASSGDNRAVEFDQYPSEVMSKVLVYKTPDGALIGQGISGTVDLQTVRPLEYGKQTTAFNVRGQRNSLGSLNPQVSANGYRASAVYIDQFLDKTVGLSLAYAHLDNTFQAQRFEAWGYTDLPNAKGTTVLGGGKAYADSGKGKRDGVMGTLEFRPNSALTSVVDVYYSHFDEDIYRNGMEGGTVWGPGKLTGTPTVVNGFTTQSQWTGVKPVLVNRFEPRTDELSSIGWNTKYRVDGWTLVGDVSYSSARRSQSFLELYAGLPTPDTLNLTMNGLQNPPSFGYVGNYADTTKVQLVDSGGWGQDGYLKSPNSKDSIKAARFDAKHQLDLGPLTDVDFGVNLQTREKTKNTEEWQLYLKNGAQAIPGNMQYGASNLSFAGVPGIASYDASTALGGLYNFKPNYYYDIWEKDWKVKEDVNTLFAKFKIDTMLGDLPLHGNVGLQHVMVKQHSNSTLGNTGLPGGQDKSPAPIDAGASYNDTLPSLNLVLDLPESIKARFGAAREMARPRMDQMTPGGHYSFDNNTLKFSGGAGNPELRPWIADATDLSVEKYFGRKGYVGVDIFYKKLKSYIYSQTVMHDFTGITPQNGMTPATYIGTWTQPMNGQGGVVKGAEFAASIPLDLFMSELEGFGFEANYTQNDSTIESNGPGSKEPLPGLSKYTSGLTAYYEKNGFSVRVSGNHRSSFVGEVATFNANRTNVYVSPETIVDFQMSYEFKDGTAKGLTLLLQANNLGNEPYREQSDTQGTQLKKYVKYGRTMMFGVNYKY